MNMKIKTKICNGENALEDFLNNELEYCGWRHEHVILGITQNGNYYTVIYKDFRAYDGN